MPSLEDVYDLLVYVHGSAQMETECAIVAVVYMDRCVRAAAEHCNVHVLLCASLVAVPLETDRIRVLVVTRCAWQILAQVAPTDHYVLAQLASSSANSPVQGDSSRARMQSWRCHVSSASASGRKRYIRARVESRWERPLVLRLL